MTVQFLYGQDDYRIDQVIKKLKKSLDKNFAAMNYKKFYNPKFSDLIGAIRTQPMMFGKMLVIIYCDKFFSKKDSITFDDRDIKEIQNALEDAEEVESLDIVFRYVIDREAKEAKPKPDGRLKITKLLNKHHAQEFTLLYPNQLEDFVKKEAHSRKLSIAEDATKLLAENIGSNLYQIIKELEKLQVIAYPNNKITKEMVKENCSTNDDFIGFITCVMKNQKDNALVEFMRLLEKKHVLEVLSGLHTMLNRCITIKLNSNKMSALDISMNFHCGSEFIIKENIKIMKDTPLKDIVQLKQNLVDVEYRIKSGLAVDEIAEVQSAIIR